MHVRHRRDRSQYFDPVSVGSLIVAIASLAWTIHLDLRRKTPKPSPEVLVRHLRAELRERGQASGQATERIVGIVVTEINPGSGQ